MEFDMPTEYFNLMSEISFAERGDKVVLHPDALTQIISGVGSLSRNLLRGVGSDKSNKIEKERVSELSEIGANLLFEAFHTDSTESFTNHLVVIDNKIVFNAAVSAEADNTTTSEKRKQLLRELEKMNQLNKVGMGVQFSGKEQGVIYDMLSVVHEDKESSGPFAETDIMYCNRAALFPGMTAVHHIKFRQ